VFLLLAAMLAVAAVALAYQLVSNPLTRTARGSAERRGLLASSRIVLGSPWARIMLIAVGIEGTFFQGIFSYIGADLHLRFGLSFTAVGIIIGIFALGGLIYAATVKTLMRRLGQTGIAKWGGAIMGLSFLTLAAQPVWYFAPLAMLGVGIGFYMLHNTLQTEATQMVPQARGTGVTLFASMYFLGQTLGVALGAPVMDRYGGPPLFVIAAIVLPALAFWFTRNLRRRQL
jgi:YNFM family putative membrane transporter